jgi:hypothetical protein
LKSLKSVRSISLPIKSIWTIEPGLPGRHRRPEVDGYLGRRCPRVTAVRRTDGYRQAMPSGYCRPQDRRLPRQAMPSGYCRPQDRRLPRQAMPSGYCRPQDRRLRLENGSGRQTRLAATLQGYGGYLSNGPELASGFCTGRLGRLPAKPTTCGGSQLQACGFAGGRLLFLKGIIHFITRKLRKFLRK